MKTLRGLVMLLVLSSGVAGAQSELRAELRDSNIVARNVLRRLFDQIPLSTKQQAEATAIIKRTWREQFTPKSGTTPERVRRGRELNAARDSALKTLLKSESEKALFEQNAAALAGGTRRRPR